MESSYLVILKDLIKIISTLTTLKGLRREVWFPCILDGLCLVWLKVFQCLPWERPLPLLQFQWDQEFLYCHSNCLQGLDSCVQATDTATNTTAYLTDTEAFQNKNCHSKRKVKRKITSCLRIVFFFLWVSEFFEMCWSVNVECTWKLLHFSVFLWF